MLRAVSNYLGDYISPVWFGRSKDITIDLMEALGLHPHVQSRAGRRIIGNIKEYASNLWRCLNHTNEVDLWVSKYGAANMAARMLNKPNLSFNDDDADVVPLIAWTSYPFSTFTLTPRNTRMGRFETRALRYDGYHELFYLHPSRFSPDATIFAEFGLEPGTPFGLVRLSALTSHHDAGVRGLGDDLLRRILERCGNDVKIFVTSEKPLSPEFEPYRCRIAPTRIHHALAHARFIVGDSQTMAAEAAVLGTPALRINDFVGRISYLADLEARELGYGFKPDEDEALLARLDQVVQTDRAVFSARRERLLAETIDPVPWFAEVMRRLLAGQQAADIRAWAETAGRKGG